MRKNHSPRRFLAICATAVALAAFATPAPAQVLSPSLDRIYQKSLKLGALGRYRQAEKLALDAASLGEKELPSDDPTLAVLFDGLGTVYRHLGRYHDAEDAFLRAFDIRFHAYGANHPKVDETIYRLGRLYRAQMREDDGLTPGSDRRLIGLVLRKIAALYRTIGRDAKAQSLSNRADSLTAEAELASRE